MNIFRRKRIYIILILLWLNVIFFSSSMNSHDSNSSSKTIIHQTIKIGSKIFGKNLSEKSIDEMTEKANYPFRKCMHASVFLILSILVLNAFKEVKMEPWKKFMYTISICFACAILDELHQLGVEGRNGQMLDVWIDTLGSIIGFYIFIIINKRKLKEI